MEGHGREVVRVGMRRSWERVEAAVLWTHWWVFGVVDRGLYLVGC